MFGTITWYMDMDHEFKKFLFSGINFMLPPDKYL